MLAGADDVDKNQGISININGKSARKSARKCLKTYLAIPLFKKDRRFPKNYKLLRCFLFRKIMQRQKLSDFYLAPLKQMFEIQINIRLV